MKKKLLSLVFIINSLFLFSQTPPNVTLDSCDETQYVFSDLFSEGKAIVIDLGSQWCIPCKSSSQFVQELYESFGENEQDAIFLGLLFEDDDSNLATCATVEEWDEELNLTYPTLPAGIGNNVNSILEIANTYGVPSLPWFIVFIPDPENPGQGLVAFNDNTKTTSSYEGIKNALLDNGYEQVLSTDQYSTTNLFSVYPNPAQDILSIDTSSDIKIEAMTISSIRGNVIKTFNTAASSIQISDLTSGIYFLEIKHKNGVQKVKFIKS